MASPPKRRIPQIVSHMAVACGAVVLVVWLQGRGDEATEPPAMSSADATAAVAAPADASATVAPTEDATAPQDVADDGGGGDLKPAPVRIIASPEVLRVWHLTPMKLRAEPGPGEAFTRYVWHFADGSEPASGAEVEHVFPESVADRHITLEAGRADGSKLVLSRRLPIERLAIAPLDGEPTEAWKLPKPRGRRLVLTGRSDSKSLERILIAAAGPWQANGVVLMGDGDLADRARIIVDSRVLDLPIMLLDLRPPSDPAKAAPKSPLRVVRDEQGQVKSLIRSGRSDVHVLSGLALVAIDSRGEAIEGEALRRLRANLEVAAAFPATALLSARPLAPLLDDDVQVALAYRIYEQALRHRVRFVLSGRSELAYDARYGGVGAISVGTISQRGCHRPMGSDRCQPPTVTIVDVPDKGGLRAWHLLAPDFQRRLQGQDLPGEVGKYRR